MEDPRDVMIRPVVSEKSYALSEKGVYIFIDVYKRQALVPAAQAATTSAHEGASLLEALDAAAAAADRGAQATRSMVPRLGRAGWLPERSAGHEDAGARMVAIILLAAAGANRGLGSPG